MKFHGIQKTVRPRHYVIVVAFAVMGLTVLLARPYYVTEPKPVVYNADEHLVATATPFYRVIPTRLQIPAIALDTTFTEPLGLNLDKTVMVPESYTEVGWYKNGVTPGAIGAAVILGHVDSKEGPGVFYSLGQLNVGDEIIVTNADNSIATFVVTELERYPQSDFPSDRVYTSEEEAVLRLVTCTGTFNRGESRYSHNLVVYATLK